MSANGPFVADQFIVTRGRAHEHETLLFEIKIAACGSWRVLNEAKALWLEVAYASALFNVLQNEVSNPAESPLKDPVHKEGPGEFTSPQKGVSFCQKRDLYCVEYIDDEGKRTTKPYPIKAKMQKLVKELKAKSDGGEISIDTDAMRKSLLSEARAEAEEFALERVGGTRVQ